MDNPGRKHVTAGTHRVCSFSETIARVEPLAKAMGITRVASVTGLDYLGIPVVMSVRPLSRGLSVQQGKGLSEDAATASGLMESVESFAAEQYSAGPMWLAPGAEERMLVPSANLLRADLPDDLILPWVAAFDLLTNAPILVPEEMVRFDVSLPRSAAAAWFWSTTNGLAAGNSLDEALVHAICELIERDAEALWWQTPQCYRKAARFDPRTVDDSSVNRLLDRYDEADIAVETWDLTSDVLIPCFLCHIDDRHGKGAYLGRSAGTGCHLSVAVALCRALTEAAQGRLTGIVGTRDDLTPDRYAVTDWHRDAACLLFDGATAVEGKPAPRARSCDSASTGEDLGTLLRRLCDAGIGSLIYVDLTARALGVPCVRVIAPELEGACRSGYYRAGLRAERWKTLHA
jgi:ribosomal protein S12 methylthiotransferase accessory factor